MYPSFCFDVLLSPLSLLSTVFSAAEVFAGAGAGVGVAEEAIDVEEAEGCICHAGIPGGRFNIFANELDGDIPLCPVPAVALRP